MKIRLLLPFLLLLAGCAGGSGKKIADLEYRLAFTPGNKIHVILKYWPLEADSIKFTYGEPMYGGQPDILKGLTGLVTEGARSMKLDTSSRQIILALKGTRPVIITYDIIDTHTAAQGTRGELFRPLILNDYFYCHGINLFLSPVFSDKKIKATQSVKWEKLPGFALFQSYDPENDGTRISTGNQEDFMYKLITGASDLIIDKTRVDNTENFLVMRILKEKDYNSKEISDYFGTFYSAIRSFWRDTSKISYSLILQPFLAVDHSISGMSLGSGFAGKYSFKTDTILNPERIFVLSHEIGHHWLGGEIVTEEKDQWFEEGFNDYLTFYMLMRCGYMNPSRFVEKFNEILKSHYTSKINRLPNDSVWANYWKMGDYNKLPYRRGCIFAFYLDNQIRLAGNGKNMHDLWLSILEFCKNKGKDYKMTEADFTELASQFVNKEKIRNDIDRYIIKGEPIEFTKEMLVDAFGITWHGDIPQITSGDESKIAWLFD